MPLCLYDSWYRSHAARRAWRRRATASAGRSAGGARSIFQYLVDVRPSQWRRHEALDGQANTLTAYARIDGKSYRIMGRERQAGSELAQTRLEVLPTRTIYEFAGAGATLGLTFFTPALPDDLDVLSRPLTYIEWTAASTDGARARRGRSISMPPATWWSTRRTSRCWRRAISSTGSRCCAWARASSRAGQARRRPAHRLGLPLPRRRQGRGCHHLCRRPRAGARRVRCSGPAARIRRSSAKCAAAVRCWPMQSRWERSRRPRSRAT